jgi:hypothetical protein
MSCTTEGVNKLAKLSMTLGIGITILFMIAVLLITVVSKTVHTQ